MDDPSGTMRMRGGTSLLQRVFGARMKKKKSALVAATGCIACGGKKEKSDASRLAVPLQTHQMATVGRMPSRTREEKLRQEGSGLPVWRTRPEQCACEEVLLCCKGFLGLGYKKKKSALVAATGCMPERRHLLGANESQTLRPGRQTKLHSLRWKKKKSDASRLAVPLQTHQMATVGRMPSRTREEELRQEGSGLPVWRTRPEQCACEKVLLCCKGFLGLGYKKKKSALVAATGCMTDCGVCLQSRLRLKSDASRLLVPLQTHQMATLGRMPSRTREEELRQEGSGLPVWRTRPEQCAYEEVLLCCKEFLGQGSPR
ncbi:uncharacterized protein LOC133497117 isoform X1 [Syngnathoides biaculeatus]|uniref:uncharacterized protein LOC133497117 isoform X1 n=1 Tax=Syngnathoides biaculeatus TaxID=300417 RepID=UPI002ADE015D|nr:uncharacterized protein LOC133497117 isoform X1 [Syngnathoides biaculeatus]